MEPVLAEAQVNQISIEESKKLKDLKEVQKKEKAKERRKLFPRLVKGTNLSHAEESLLMKKAKVVKSEKDLKSEIEVKFDRRTHDQLGSLPNKHKARFWSLIDDIKAGGTDGQPEKLNVGLNGENLFSRRINKKHRIVYTLSNNVLTILSCKGHYND